MMAEEREGETTDLDRLHDAIIITRKTGKPVPFFWRETELKVDKIDGNLEVGLKDPKKALSSSSALGDLHAAANAVDELEKTIPRGSVKRLIK